MDQKHQGLTQVGLTTRAVANTHRARPPKAIISASNAANLMVGQTWVPTANANPTNSVPEALVKEVRRALALAIVIIVVDQA